MKNGIKYSLERTDFFAQNVLLNFNKEKSFRTILGGFLSLIMYGVSIAVIVISGIQLIKRQNPKTTYTQKNLGIAPVIDISNYNTLFLAFYQLANTNYDQFYDPTYISLNWYQFKSTRYSNGTQITSKTLIPWTNCTNYYNRFVEHGLESYFTSNNLKFSFCLDSGSINTTIGGDFTSSFYSNIYVSLDSCKNSTNSNITCKSTEEINRKIKDGYFNLVYFDKYVDVNNYNQPFVNYINTFFQKIDPSLYKKIDLYFELANVTSNVGLIFDDYRTNSSLLLDTHSVDVETSSVSTKLMNIYVNVSPNSSLNTRNYMKFQELAALFGGIFQAMKVVGYIITYPVVQFKMYEHMFNSLFTQKDEGVKKHHIAMANKEIKKLKIFLEEKGGIHKTRSLPLTREEKYMSPYTPIVSKKNYLDKPSFTYTNEKNTNKEIVMKQIDHKINVFHSKISKKFSFNIHEVICMYLCNCCNKNYRAKRNIFNMGFRKLLKYLDLLEIMKTLQQFHQLKDILLSTNQSKLFEYYNKPEMSTDIDRVERKSSEGSYLNLYNCYIKASNKINNKINRKLINNFDSNLKDMFKSFDPDTDNEINKMMPNKLDNV